MALYTFAEVSTALQCSPQNVYQKRNKLKELGYIEKDNDRKRKNQ